jgi:hypothetical protein
MKREYLLYINLFYRYFNMRIEQFIPHYRDFGLLALKIGNSFIQGI